MFRSAVRQATSHPIHHSENPGGVACLDARAGGECCTVRTEGRPASSESVVQAHDLHTAQYSEHHGSVVCVTFGRSWQGFGHAPQLHSRCVECSTRSLRPSWRGLQGKDLQRPSFDVQLSLALCGQVVFFFFSEFQHVAVVIVGSSRASRPSRRLSCASFLLGACRSILLGCPANEPRI